MALGAASLTRLVGMVVAPPSSPDELALTSIERERDAAVARYRRYRDSEALDEAMARLDAQKREARRPREVEGVPADVAVAHGFAAAIPDRLDVTVGYGRGERTRADTTSLLLLIPVTNVPSRVCRATEIAWAGYEEAATGRSVVSLSGRPARSRSG